MSPVALTGHCLPGDVWLSLAKAMHFSTAEGHDELLPLREAQGGGTVSRQKKSAMEGWMAVGA